ncbi:hypothetical protein N9529_02165 [Crocinitomicaceae bacterium]|nr:hypothetical protein [Crocinitomicaceae bacterium]
MLKYLFIATLIFIPFSSYAQPYKTIKPYKPYKWMIGLHWTAVDDDGNKFGNIFDVNNSWNIKPFPTRFTLDRYFVYGWSIEMAVSYAAYTPDILVNDSTGREGINLSIDFNAKYSFYNLYAPRARWIEPYLIAGVGFTYRTGTADPYVPTVNLGGGINLWIVNWFGIQLSSTAKFAVYPKVWDTKSNYLQHNAGLVFRTPDKAKQKNQNSRKQHKWTNKQPKKIKRRKGGH